MCCITEILKLKGDREVFIPLDKSGHPWIAVEGGGKYKDYEYLIVLNHHGHRCGYVAIPAKHPANDVGYSMNKFYKGMEEFNYHKLDIDCHGGLTFGSKNHGLKDLLKNPCADNWIGFDCGHAGDHCDVEAFIKYYGEEEAKEKKTFFDAMNYGTIFGMGSVKDYSYAEDECKSIIDQLIEKAA
jgi:hypothetical protein